jgi:hypothetical protein
MARPSLSVTQSARSEVQRDFAVHQDDRAGVSSPLCGAVEAHRISAQRTGVGIETRTASRAYILINSVNYYYIIVFKCLFDWVFIILDSVSVMGSILTDVCFGAERIQKQRF